MTPTADHSTTVHRWHALAVSDVLIHLDSVANQGLSPNEAARCLGQHGPHTLPEAKHRSMWTVFVRQFVSPLIYILFVAAVIALAMGHRGDAGVILVVVFLHALIGTVQEGRAERSMESLRKLSALELRVRRGGTETSCTSSSSTEPLNRIFHTVPIPLTDVFLIGAVASLVLWTEEIRKFFARRHIRHHLSPASP